MYYTHYIYCTHSDVYFSKPFKDKNLVSSCLMCFVVLLFLQLGGAMAPTIKELSRWLDANSEYYVTPEWATVVKHSVSMTCSQRLDGNNLRQAALFFKILALQTRLD